MYISKEHLLLDVLRDEVYGSWPEPHPEFIFGTLRDLWGKLVGLGEREKKDDWDGGKRWIVWKWK